MWKAYYAIGTLFGSVLLFTMWELWSLTWKQIGVYLLLSFFSETFFRTAHSLRREAGSE